MSTHFVGEGNIGSAPDYREFPNGNDEPRRLLRLNVYFDNPIPKKDGEFEDRGGQRGAALGCRQVSGDELRVGNIKLFPTFGGGRTRVSRSAFTAIHVCPTC